ncbi:MAG: ECF-type sigma factor [Acidobacteriota bacterium]
MSSQDESNTGSSHEFTLLLGRWMDGDEAAVEDLLPQAYDELRGLARHYLRNERSEHTLDATALVHEAYMRLVGSELHGATVENRRHFFALAARVMRRILVDHARRYQAARRASPADRVALEDDGFWARVEPPPDEVLAIDQALDDLRRSHPRKADVVEMRYFAGLTESETAEILGVTRLTVARDWRVARLLLARKLSTQHDDG